MAKSKDNDLQNWVKERNSRSDTSGVQILGAEKTDNGYSLELNLRDKKVIESLEAGYDSKFTKETARNLVRPKLGRRYSEHGSSVNYRDDLTRMELDILANFDPLEATPKEMYARAIEYYYRKGIYGSVVDTLTNFASKGFQNDIDDKKIKGFYDNWVETTKFQSFVDKIFFDVFRVGWVVTYKTVGRYEPAISTEKPLPGSIPKTARAVADIFEHYTAKADQEIASMKVYNEDEAVAIEKLCKEKAVQEVNKLVKDIPEEQAARKIKWSKEFIPIRYTILNPAQLQVTGNMLFGQRNISITPDKDLTDYMKLPDSELTDDEKRFRRSLAPEFKAAVKEGKPAPLNPYLVGSVDYRRQPYERYAKPRGLRTWDTLAYKEALCSADLSTVDGINNYILKVTIGSDQHPVTDFSMLEMVADAFDTPSKAFTVFWNHTLNIEKITFPEVSEILGQDKYAQANEDLTGGLAVVRALIDGKSEGSAKALDLAVKGVIEEVNYVRGLVTDWIYNEYRDIAEGMGFDRYPKVRFDDMALRDEVQMMNIIQGLIDRRILPYRKGLEKLGYSYDDVLSNLKEEMPLVLSGVLGILGSPYQQVKTTSTPSKTSKGPSKTKPANNNPKVQPIQRTPKKTPSEGRPPTGGVGKPRAAAAIEDPSHHLLKKGSFEELSSIEGIAPDHKERYIFALVDGTNVESKAQSMPQALLEGIEYSDEHDGVPLVVMVQTGRHGVYPVFTELFEIGSES